MNSNGNNMNIERINISIEKLCQHFSKEPSLSLEWIDLTANEINYELALCLVSSQNKYEKAIKIVNSFKANGILDNENLKNTTLEDLKEYLNGNKKTEIKKDVIIKPRFPSKIAQYLYYNLIILPKKHISIREMLLSAQSSEEARELLVKNIKGFGPKQSSMFLRRISYGNDLAIIDVHIKDYLFLSDGIVVKMNKLNQLSYYSFLEDSFKRISSCFGYPIRDVDYATWITMRVYKKLGRANEYS
jgi:N-glycosylase/DNA lyase